MQTVQQLLPVPVRLVAVDRLRHETRPLVQLGRLRQLLGHQVALRSLPELVQGLKDQTGSRIVLRREETGGCMLQHLDLFEQVTSNLEILACLDPLFLDILKQPAFLGLGNVLEHLHSPGIRVGVAHL